MRALGVLDADPPAHLSEEDRDLRKALCAKRDQLGQLELLVADCAYEQWHRLLFARFLAENNLLVHPQFGAPVTLAECAELAAQLGEPDAWAVAGRFATEILPGIFRLDDPSVRLRLAPEGRLALEEIVEGIPTETFVADDSLGWVYQDWQKERKDAVNQSERRIAGADLSPVTQLFTEHYMVRFLLENSLGAWWAGRHPDSPLLRKWAYLRFDADGNPAVGLFERWPSAVSDITVMDPCCGSGHFLVEAFDMLWRMRAEEEGLTAVEAQDAVLRDNLFGLELDPRCVQIAVFAVAMAAWKLNGAWRPLPPPSVACSGMRVTAPLTEWVGLAGGDSRLAGALERLHRLFKHADTLGSLIDPGETSDHSSREAGRRAFDDVDWREIAPILAVATAREAHDPATTVLDVSAAGAARAADLLARHYTLVATNVPYLVRSKQSQTLQDFADRNYPNARADLATVFLARCGALIPSGATDATVTPQNWLFLSSYAEYRRQVLAEREWNAVVRIGSGATATKSWDTLRCLLISSTSRPAPTHGIAALDAVAPDDEARATEVRCGPMLRLDQQRQLSNPDARIVFADLDDTPLLETMADSLQGISPADTSRFRRYFWEVLDESLWVRWQRPAQTLTPYGGRDSVLCWDSVLFEAVDRGDAFIRGQAAWGKRGVAVRQVGQLPATLYTGERFDTSCAVIVPHDQNLLPALWAYVNSHEFNAQVRHLDRKLNVTNATLAKVPFDTERWAEVARAAGPIPEPTSDDPTQWLFGGNPATSTAPLQTSVARLLGYCWPDQSEDLIDELADADGIVCLPSVLGERTAAERLQELLAKAFGGTWSTGRAAAMLTATGSKKADLGSWLRDEFFKEHCQLFKSRPFVWHVWDGRKDGFNALVNYHQLDRPRLERLTYSYLGDWIERQAAGAREDVVGAAERLSAARELQSRIAQILAGEPPYDIYVRWKPLSEQPIGWAPDLDDGVRLNIRPFVQAGILRTSFNVKWGKDRGKNPDGSERRNDLHLSNAEKQAARGAGREI